MGGEEYRVGTASATSTGSWNDRGLFADRIWWTQRHLDVHAITAAQFANVPATAAEATVTLREEDRIAAYFGAGLLYAVRGRQESVL